MSDSRWGVWVRMGWLGGRQRRVGAAAAVGLGAFVLLVATPALADKIANKIAVFAFLDKVTARISNKAIPLNTTVQFGSLQVTPRVCYSRPATEEPKTTSFVEVTDKKLDGTSQQIFSGWMLAQSPGLHAVEHPVYDVWLTDCQNPAGAAVQAVKAKSAAGVSAPDAAVADTLDAQTPDAASLDALPAKKHHVKRQ